jgi:hypothetical protein
MSSVPWRRSDLSVLSGLSIFSAAIRDLSMTFYI